VFKIFCLPVMGIRRELAYLAAVVCAIHPVASEVVYPIASGRETLLPAVFILSSLYFYCKPGRANFVPAALFYLVSLFCKEQAIMVPFVFLAADGLGIAGWKPGKNARVWLLKYGVTGVITVAYLIIRHVLFGGSEYALNQIILGPVFTILYSLQTIIAPSVQLIYEPTGQNAFSPYRLLFCGAVMCLIAWLVYRRWSDSWKLIAFWSVYFIFFLLPTANIIQQDAFYSERYVFVSMVGVVAIAFNLLSAYWKPMAGKLNLRFALVLLPVLVLAGMTFYRGSFYKDSIAFYHQWVKTNPTNPSAQNGYGCRLQEKGKLQEAIYHLQLAIKYSPKEPYPYYNLALLYFNDLKQYDAALWYLDRVMLNDPGTIIQDALLMKADALHNLGRDDEALGWYRKYLELSPDNIGALYNVAVIDEQTKNSAEALQYYQRVVALDSGYEDARQRYHRLATEPR
jgi:tetratricopeptide (TPR) repeat protein